MESRNGQDGKEQKVEIPADAEASRDDKEGTELIEASDSEGFRAQEEAEEHIQCVEYEVERNAHVYHVT